MDLQTLSDREELVELIALYNKASFYCDVDGYARTFTTDGRYINANHGWVGFGGREAGDAIAAEYRNRTGLQHLCLDYVIDFVGRDCALVRHHMLMFQRRASFGSTLRGFADDYRPIPIDVICDAVVSLLARLATARRSLAAFDGIEGLVTI